MFYTGIDLHRRSIVVCTVDQNGVVLARRSMKNNQDLVVSYFSQWPSEQQRSGETATRGELQACRGRA